MSIHPSLSSSKGDKKTRSVLKRTERLRIMMEKGQWKEGDNVYGLPKIKTIRIKIKKEKAAEKVEAAAAEAATEAAAPASSETKEQPPAKGPAGNLKDKK
jgi:small basic protein (TIGR04137 family)